MKPAAVCEPLWLATLAAFVIRGSDSHRRGRWTDPWETSPLRTYPAARGDGPVGGRHPARSGWARIDHRLVLSGARRSQCLLDRGASPLGPPASRSRRCLITCSAPTYVDAATVVSPRRTISVITRDSAADRGGLGPESVVGPVWAPSSARIAMALSPSWSVTRIRGCSSHGFCCSEQSRWGWRSSDAAFDRSQWAALIGLAASSKFHFGMWIVPPPLCLLGEWAIARCSLENAAVAGHCAEALLGPW